MSNNLHSTPVVSDHLVINLLSDSISPCIFFPAASTLSPQRPHSLRTLRLILHHSLHLLHNPLIYFIDDIQRDQLLL